MAEIARAAGSGALLDELPAERDRAFSCAGVTERLLRLGGRAVRLRVAGRALGRSLLTGLAGDDAEGRQPPVRIDAWEETAIDGGASPVPWQFADIGPGGLVRDLPHGSVAVHETFSGAVTLFDPRSRTVLHRVPSATTMPWWEQAAPLRPALHLALGGDGRSVVHGGAVGDRRGTLLIVGRPGAGKTTAVLAGLAAGLAFVADDYLLLDASVPAAHPLYRTISVRRESGDGTKAVLERDPAPGANAAVLAVAVVSVRGGRSRARPIPPASALRPWASSTALQMPFDGGAVVPLLARVVSAVPCFAVSVGDDQVELGATLLTMVDRLGARA